MDDTPQQPKSTPVSLSMAIVEKSALQACYMPFIKDGGLFVPTTDKFSLHDEVVLHLRLVEDGKKLLIPGRVVWISPVSVNVVLAPVSVCNSWVNTAFASNNSLKRC